MQIAFEVEDRSIPLAGLLAQGLHHDGVKIAAKQGLVGSRGDAAWLGLRGAPFDRPFTPLASTVLGISQRKKQDRDTRRGLWWDAGYLGTTVN